MKLSLITHTAGIRSGHYTEYASNIFRSINILSKNIDIHINHDFKSKLCLDSDNSDFNLFSENLNLKNSALFNMFQCLLFYHKSLKKSSNKQILFLDFSPPPTELLLLPLLVFVRPGPNYFAILHRNPLIKTQSLLKNFYRKIISSILFSLLQKRITYFTHNVDLALVKNNVRYLNYGLKDFKLPSSKNKSSSLRLLFFGGLEKSKGIINLINVVKRMAKQEIFLTIVGKSNTLKLEEILKACANSKNITINEGYASDKEVMEYFNYSDCLILPYDEGWNATSGPLHQSIQCEVPVIVSNVPQLSYLVRKYDIGLVNENNTLVGLARTILKMKIINSKFGKNLKYAKSKLTFDNLTKELVKEING